MTCLGCSAAPHLCPVFVRSAGRLEDEVLQDAKPEDVTVEAYNAIIHVCTQAVDMERAEMYFHQMENRGIEPTVVTYNLVINACARVGDSMRAEDWLTLGVSGCVCSQV